MANEQRMRHNKAKARAEVYHNDMMAVRAQYDASRERADALQADVDTLQAHNERLARVILDAGQIDTEGPIKFFSNRVICLSVDLSRDEAHLLPPAGQQEIRVPAPDGIMFLKVETMRIYNVLDLLSKASKYKVGIHTARSEFFQEAHDWLFAIAQNSRATNRRANA
jgi:hypothetical protein